MSSPAAACALITAATASRYCSRNKESPIADLNERPFKLASYHNGRGYEPVIAVGNTMSRVVVSMTAELRRSVERCALDRDAVQQTPLAVIIIEREVPGRAVVPQRQRALAPAEAAGGFGRGRLPV